jgi:putative copper export protein
MLFKLLIIFHILGASIWTGGHLILSLTILPKALQKQEPDLIHNFESSFETLGLAALFMQVITGLWLTLIYFPSFHNFLAFDSYLATYIATKLGLLLLTIALAVHARLFIIPNLKPENLTSLAYHIVGVTTLAVLLAILGAGIRVGGFFG